MSDFKKRLTQVDEQTRMLLEKQLEAKKYCDNEFSDLLSLIDQKVQETDEEDKDYKSLIRIHELVSDQFSKFSQDVEDDIQFLKEQVKAIEEIQKIEDDVKAEELFLSILDEDEELLETVEFKKGLQEETDFAKKSFIEIMNDIKNSLQEGKLEDLEALLNSMEMERKDQLGEEGLDVFEDDNDDSGCSSCSGCSSRKGGCGPDLFAGLFDDDEEDKEDK